MELGPSGCHAALRLTLLCGTRKLLRVQGGRQEYGQCQQYESRRHEAVCGRHEIGCSRNVSAASGNPGIQL